MGIEITWKPSKKQFEAYKILNDRVTTEFFYGGGAGGGKSYIGCVWLIMCCIQYPGSRWLMGRAILKSLKESTLLTFFMICKEWGLIKGDHYKYSLIANVITFWNGSEIYLKDLFLYPSDPEFDSLGSTEYTGAFIDECSQVSLKAKNIVMSRIRYKLEEFDLIPKLFMASNPSKNFLYHDFYKPWREGTLLPYRKFLPALVQDNPFISPYYIENLQKLDKVSKERLLHGNFEYDDDPSVLFNYDSIVNMFGNDRAKRGEMYLSVDVARYGKDKTVMFLWCGFFIQRIFEYPKTSTREVRHIITNHMKTYKVDEWNVVIDEDGVGGGVVDEMVAVKGFINNSSPINPTTKYEQEKRPHNYSNLKSQCYFKLADFVNNGLIGCYSDVDVSIKELLIEDLEQIKRKDHDKDVKLSIIPKDKIKEATGRSPDFSDAMMMRMLFEVNEDEVVMDFGV